MIPNIIKLVSVLLGLLLIYVGLFLYPDEEGRIQNRIENLWVAINDRKKVSGDEATALFNKVGEVIGRMFNRILGRRLISVQMVGVSTSASFAGFLGGVGLLLLFLLCVGSSRHNPSIKPEFLASLFFVGVFCVVVGFVFFIFAALPSFWPSRLSRILSMTPILFFAVAALQVARKHLAPVHVHTMQMWFAAISASLLSDVILLSGSRLSIRWISVSTRRFRILLAFLVQISIVTVLAVVPWELSGVLLVKNPKSSGANILIYIAGLNLFTALAASAFTLMLLLVLLHRIFWPVLDRLIYPLARFAVFQNRTIVVGLGFLFAYYPIASNATLGKIVLDWLQKRLG